MKITSEILTHTIFLDVETVAQHASFEELDERGKAIWSKKAGFLNRGEPLNHDDVARLYSERAAICAEFGKIICISVGILHKEGDTFRLRVKSFTGDENRILEDFKLILDKHFYNIGQHYICGHNINEFDIPYICRRMVVHDIKLPQLLDVAGLKPWQITQFVDTMAMWRFGDYKNYTSLDVLSYTLGIDSPKDGIDGSQVGKVYYEDNDLNSIRQYCEKDVLTTAQILLKYASNPLLEQDGISFLQDEEE